MSCKLIELPKYQCHKQVWALKIRDLTMTPRGYTIIPFEPNYPPFEVSKEWVEKHQPKVGGYWVRDEDGYTSFSPAGVFEAGYTLI